MPLSESFLTAARASPGFRSEAWTSCACARCELAVTQVHVQYASSGVPMKDDTNKPLSDLKIVACRNQLQTFGREVTACSLENQDVFAGGAPRGWDSVGSVSHGSGERDLPAQRGVERQRG